MTLTDAAAAWPALTVRGLGKSFGPKVAVAEINVDVPRGSFFGIVGPNGAGKTTTLRMATGLLRPDRGQVWVDGIDVWADPIAAKARIGVLPEDLALFERLRGRELEAEALVDRADRRERISHERAEVHVDDAVGGDGAVGACRDRAVEPGDEIPAELAGHLGWRDRVGAEPAQRAQQRRERRDDSQRVAMGLHEQRVGVLVEQRAQAPQVAG